MVRNWKGKKHSEYAPEEGNRYDGIYKVVRYWPSKGKSGFIVWRYELRRDDPCPAPWTEEGRRKIEEDGLEMIYPPGYLEAQAEKEKEAGKGKKRGKDDSQEEGDFIDDDAEEEEEGEKTPKAKKAKLGYKLSSEWLELMSMDVDNNRLWEKVRNLEPANKKELLDAVEEMFCCIICQVRNYHCCPLKIVVLLKFYRILCSSL